VELNQPSYPSGEEDGPAAFRQVLRFLLRDTFIAPWSTPDEQDESYTSWADWLPECLSAPTRLGHSIEWYVQAYARWLIGRPMRPAGSSRLAAKVALTLTGLALAYFAIIEHPFRFAEAHALPGAIKLESIDRAQRTWAGILGLIGALLLAYAHWRPARAARENAATAKVEIAKRREMSESFSCAVEQLGDPSVPVRLGGIASLELVAFYDDESPDRSDRYLLSIIDVLSGFLRTRSSDHQRLTELAEADDRPITNGPGSVGMRADISAVGATLGRLLSQARQRGVRAQLNLERCDLAGVGFAQAHLVAANLTNAKLRRANLHRANCSDALLTRADLSRCDLRGADLSSARLRRANLASANLSEALLVGTNLRMANLRGAILSGVDFEGADLTDATLIRADISGADLTGATGLTQKQINLASAEPGSPPTVPPGLHPPIRRGSR
jgi:hypothetical protein